MIEHGKLLKNRIKRPKPEMFCLWGHFGTLLSFCNVILRKTFLLEYEIGMLQNFENKKNVTVGLVSFSPIYGVWAENNKHRLETKWFLFSSGELEQSGRTEKGSGEDCASIQIPGVFTQGRLDQLATTERGSRPWENETGSGKFYNDVIWPSLSLISHFLTSSLDSLLRHR